MSGIVSYGAYVPPSRLALAAIAAQLRHGLAQVPGSARGPLGE